MNPLLTKIQNGVKAKIPANLQDAFLRTTLAGRKLMFDPQSHDLLIQRLKQTPDLVVNAANGSANLVAYMYKESKKTMPAKVIAPAAMFLLCEMLDFLERSGKIQITKEVIAQATRSVAGATMHKFGVNQQTMAAMKANGAQPAPPVSAPPQGIIAQAQGAA